MSTFSETAEPCHVRGSHDALYNGFQCLSAAVAVESVGLDRGYVRRRSRPSLETLPMTARILVAYDRPPLGDLAVEAAFTLARSLGVAELHVLAIPAISGAVGHRETLYDDLIAIARLGQRFGVAVDGIVMQSPDVQRIATEIRLRRIDRLVIAKPAGCNGGTAIGQLLDAAAEATGVDTIVVREDDP